MNSKETYRELTKSIRKFGRDILPKDHILTEPHRRWEFIIDSTEFRFEEGSHGEYGISINSSDFIGGVLSSDGKYYVNGSFVKLPYELIKMVDNLKE